MVPVHWQRASDRSGLMSAVADLESSRWRRHAGMECKRKRGEKSLEAERLLDGRWIKRSFLLVSCSQNEPSALNFTDECTNYGEFQTTQVIGRPSLLWFGKHKLVRGYNSPVLAAFLSRSVALCKRVRGGSLGDTFVNIAVIPFSLLMAIRVVVHKMYNYRRMCIDLSWVFFCRQPTHSSRNWRVKCQYLQQWWKMRISAVSLSVHLRQKHSVSLPLQIFTTLYKESAMMI